MTTPRDDIAGLIERLRNRTSLQAYVQLTFRHSYDYEAGRALLDEAATAIDALQERVKELEAERDKWDRRVAYDELKAREYENRATQQRQIDNLTIRAEAAESRALRAEQERDEAYKRAAKVAFARAARWKDAMEHEDSPCGMSLYDECLDIGAIIRRLSACPEKDGK